MKTFYKVTIKICDKHLDYYFENFDVVIKFIKNHEKSNISWEKLEIEDYMVR